MGMGAFIYGTNFSEHGLVAVGIVGPVPCLMCLVIRLSVEIRYRVKKGTWFKEGAASRVRTPDGAVLWKSLIPVVANILTNVSSFLLLSLGWKFAKASDMNQGVIYTLVSFASLINIVVFYFKFGEKISYLHFIGVILMLLCIICISMAATGAE